MEPGKDSKTTLDVPGGRISPGKSADPLNRRFPGGRLKGYVKSYFEARDNLLSSDILPRVLQSARDGKGPSYDELLLMPELSKYDERVVEYSWILWKLAGLDHVGDSDLLDVGCVMNMDVIATHLSEIFNMVWFLNSAQEELVYKDNAAYILADVRDHRLPKNMLFDVVTCFSTLEHIGMDNTRYGARPEKVDLYEDNPQRNAMEALGSIYSLVKTGGTLYLSLPYGPFEYLYSYGGGDQPIYYTIDQKRLEDLLSCLPGNAGISTEIFKVVPDVGWVRTEPGDKDILPHASDCSAAGGVALVEVLRK